MTYCTPFGGHDPTGPDHIANRSDSVKKATIQSSRNCSSSRCGKIKKFVRIASKPGVERGDKGGHKRHFSPSFLLLFVVIAVTFSNDVTSEKVGCFWVV